MEERAYGDDMQVASQPPECPVQAFNIKKIALQRTGLESISSMKVSGAQFVPVFDGLEIAVQMGRCCSMEVNRSLMPSRSRNVISPQDTIDRYVG